MRVIWPQEREKHNPRQPTWELVSIGSLLYLWLLEVKEHFFKFFSDNFLKINLSTFIRPKLILSKGVWELEGNINYPRHLPVQRLGDLKAKTWKEGLDRSVCAPQIITGPTHSTSFRLEKGPWDQITRAYRPQRHQLHLTTWLLTKLFRNVPFGKPLLISVCLILSRRFYLNGLSTVYLILRWAILHGTYSLRAYSSAIIRLSPFYHPRQVTRAIHEFGNSVPVFQMKKTKI